MNAPAKPLDHTTLIGRLGFLRCVMASSIAMLTASTVAGEEITPRLEKIRAQHGVPALAAAAYHDGKLVAIGVTGLRRVNGTESVTVEDRWHLGSCTKSMTASLAARFVESGKISWKTTLGESLAKLQPKMLPAWKDVTLEQLLGHRAGAPHDAPFDLWAKAWERKGSREDQRAEFCQGLLLLPPDPAPGTGFVYSNQGYSLAAAMLVATTHRTWEAMITEDLFLPLGLKSAGFGSSGTPGQPDQPWGHIGQGEKIKAVPSGPDADNPPAIWAGGGVHMSIGDFARYAAWHADRRELLRPESFETLHRPLPGQEYALGWFVTSRPWGGTVLTHNGTNNSNYATMWISPEKRFAVVAACNAAGKPASTACDEACATLIRQILSSGQ